MVRFKVGDMLRSVKPSATVEWIEVIKVYEKEYLLKQHHPKGRTAEWKIEIVHNDCRLPTDLEKELYL